MFGKLNNVPVTLNYKDTFFNRYTYVRMWLIKIVKVVFTEVLKIETGMFVTLFIFTLTTKIVSKQKHINGVVLIFNKHVFELVILIKSKTRNKQNNNFLVFF